MKLVVLLLACGVTNAMFRLQLTWTAGEDMTLALSPFKRSFQFMTKQLKAGKPTTINSHSRHHRDVIDFHFIFAKNYTQHEHKIHFGHLVEGHSHKLTFFPFGTMVTLDAEVLCIVQYYGRKCDKKCIYGYDERNKVCRE